MKAAKIRSKLETLIRNLYDAGEKEPIPEDFILLGQEGIFDSVSALQLVLAIEKEFGIVIEDKDIHPKHFKDIDCLTRYIQNKSVDSKAR